MKLKNSEGQQPFGVLGKSTKSTSLRTFRATTASCASPFSPTSRWHQRGHKHSTTMSLSLWNTGFKPASSIVLDLTFRRFFVLQSEPGRQMERHRLKSKLQTQSFNDKTQRQLNLPAFLGASANLLQRRSKPRTSRNECISSMLPSIPRACS